MAQFKPIKCTKAQMDAKVKSEGQLFFCTDTGYIYLDISSTNRMILNANKAIQDSAGQQINTTYLKNLSLNTSTNNLVYTKGNGTNGYVNLPYATKEYVDKLEYQLNYEPLDLTFYNDIPSGMTGIYPDTNTGADVLLSPGSIGNVYFTIQAPTTDISNGGLLISVSEDYDGTLNVEEVTGSMNYDLSDRKIIIQEWGMSYPFKFKMTVNCDATSGPNSKISIRRVADFQDTSANSTQYLSVTNQTPYTPAGDYHPSTKRYVDDSIDNVKTYTNNLINSSIKPQACTPATLTNISTQYKFILNDNGYFINNNAKKGANNSYVLGRVKFYAKNTGKIILSYRSYGESTYDYGIFGQLDKALSESSNDDGASGSTKVLVNCKGSASSEYKQITYNITTLGEHFFDIKYRKDSSTDSNDDTLQFQLKSSDVIGSIILAAEGESTDSSSNTNYLAPKIILNYVSFKPSDIALESTASTKMKTLTFSTPIPGEIKYGSSKPDLLFLIKVEAPGSEDTIILINDAYGAYFPLKDSNNNLINKTFNFRLVTSNGNITGINIENNISNHWLLQSDNITFNTYHISAFCIPLNN